MTEIFVKTLFLEGRREWKGNFLCVSPVFLSALSDMGQSSSDLRALEACCAERSRTLRMDSPVSRPAGPLKGQVVSFDCVEDIAVSEDVLHAVQRDNQSEQMSSPNSSQLTDTTVSITPPSNQGTHSASRLPVSPELVFGASHLKIQESARWNKRELRTGESPNLAAAVELSDKSQGNGGNAAIERWLDERSDRSQRIQPGGLQGARKDSHALISKLVRAEHKHLQNTNAAKGLAEERSAQKKCNTQMRRWRLLEAGVPAHQIRNAEARDSQTKRHLLPISTHGISTQYQ